MKIAITATGNTPISTIDPRFGRCQYFALYDTSSKALEFVENPNRDANEGAGPASAQFVIDRGARQIVSGEFGGKVKTVLEAMGIVMLPQDDCSQTVGSIISKMN